MYVIRHGKEYKRAEYTSCECTHCGCLFEYSETEKKAYLNDEEYVICPECHQDIKLATPMEG